MRPGRRMCGGRRSGAGPLHRTAPHRGCLAAAARSACTAELALAQWGGPRSLGTKWLCCKAGEDGQSLGGCRKPESALGPRARTCPLPCAPGCTPTAAPLGLRVSTPTHSKET